jgi:tetratricopeptide (TPR) repeat protein
LGKNDRKQQEQSPCSSGEIGRECRWYFKQEESGMFKGRMWKWIGVVVGIGLAMVMAVQAQTNSVPEGEAILRRAYLAVVQAELARAEKRVPDAVSGYKTALSLFGRLQVEYPGWHGDMVGYRVADCNNAIALLDPLGGVAPTESAEGTATNAVRVATLVQELKSARGWLAEDASTTAGRQMLLERELEQVRRERDESVKRAQVSDRQAAKLETRLRRFEKGEDTVKSNAFVLLPAAIRGEAMRLMQESQYNKAMSLLREGIEVMPDRQDFEVLAGVVACRAGQFDIAVSILKPFDTKKPVNADALLTLGTAWMGLGKIGEARVATEKALLLNPKSPEANYNMAQIYLTIKPSNPVAAEKYYQQALDLGLEADADFENSLRMAFIVSRLKKRVEK